MQTNMGTVDRAIRALVGLVLIALAFAGALPWWVGLIGLIPLGTAALASCPAYTMLGIRTCRAPTRP